MTPCFIPDISDIYSDKKVFIYLFRKSFNVNKSKFTRVITAI